MSLLLRSFRRRQFDAQHEHEAHDSDQEPDVSPGPSSLHRRYSRPRRAAAHSDDDSDDDDNGDNASHDDDGPSPYHEEGNEDGLPRPNSVLPLFSSPQLGTHTSCHASRHATRHATETFCPPPSAIFLPFYLSCLSLGLPPHSHQPIVGL